MYILNPINNQLHSIQIDGYALISVYVYSTMTQGKLKYFTGLSPVYPNLGFYPALYYGVP